ncbi:MAG: hypothetical protein ACO1SV_17435 [Fimbriimonas sp.]
MLLAVSLALVSAPLQIDWNGEALGRALEALGPTLGARLRCEPTLAQEPVFALVTVASPQETLDRIAEVMVASWQREADGSLRLARLPSDRERTLRMRRADTERRYGDAMAAYVKAAGLTQPATHGQMWEAMRKLKAMADDRLPDPLGRERTLSAGLASGRLVARCLQSVGIEGLGRVPTEGRAVFSTSPTPRQGAIPSGIAILNAFRAEHPVYVTAYEGIGSIGGASDGRPYTVDDLSGNPARLRFEAVRSPSTEDLRVTATVFADDGTWLFDHSETFPSRSAQAALAHDFHPLADPSDRAVQFESLRLARTEPAKAEQAALDLMRPDPLAPVFGERLRAIAKRARRNFIGRFPDRPLFDLLDSSPKDALEGLLEHATVTEGQGWIVAVPRDPLSAEGSRTPRSALFAIAQAAQRDAQLREAPLLAFSREVPQGIGASLAHRYLRYFRAVGSYSQSQAAVLHVIASSTPDDLRNLGAEAPYPVTRLGRLTQRAIERFLLDVPEHAFTAQRWADGEWSEVAFLERCEPTSRIPGALTNEVYARLESETEWRISGESGGKRTGLQPAQLADWLHARRRGGGPVYDRFFVGWKTNYRLKVWAGDDWMESHTVSLNRSEGAERGLSYDQLPTALRHEVEAILGERRNGDD